MNAVWHGFPRPLVRWHFHHEFELHLNIALVGMSISSFSHYFTKATGSNLSEFLNRIRVSRACELLSATDTQITEICYAVGFNNIANFNRRFRLLKGMTPREYRKRTLLGHQ